MRRRNREAFRRQQPCSIPALVGARHGRGVERSASEDEQCPPALATENNAGWPLWNVDLSYRRAVCTIHIDLARGDVHFAIWTHGYALTPLIGKELELSQRSVRINLRRVCSLLSFVAHIEGLARHRFAQRKSS